MSALSTIMVDKLNVDNFGICVICSNYPVMFNWFVLKYLRKKGCIVVRFERLVIYN